jgi:hypothetical protein
LTSSTNATDLSGKVAVVTGAAAGLGRAEALGLARLGATVVVNDIAAALDASDVIDEIGAAGSKAVAVTGDISQRATADELLGCADGLGGLDIVVNNAGITRDRMLFNMSDEEWDLVIAVHLRGHFLLTRNAATYWRAKAKDAGGSIFGRLVNMTADVFGPAPDISDIGEGGIDPLSPEHVVSLVQFLSSPAAADVNGQVFIVYGPQVTLVSAPTAEHKFSADGSAWEPAQLSTTLQDYFAGRDPEKNFSAVGLMEQ